MHPSFLAIRRRSVYFVIESDYCLPSLHIRSLKKGPRTCVDFIINVRRRIFYAAYFFSIHLTVHMYGEPQLFFTIIHFLYMEDQRYLQKQTPVSIQSCQNHIYFVMFLQFLSLAIVCQFIWDIWRTKAAKVKNKTVSQKWINMRLNLIKRLNFIVFITSS